MLRKTTPSPYQAFLSPKENASLSDLFFFSRPPQRDLFPKEFPKEFLAVFDSPSQGEKFIFNPNEDLLIEDGSKYKEPRP